MFTGNPDIMNNTFSENPQIGIVSSFTELIHTQFMGSMNALCWQRKVSGDFREVVSKLRPEENITEVSSEDLLNLQLSEQGQCCKGNHPQ